MQDWLNSVAPKQTDNVRFVPVVLEVNVKEQGVVEITLTTENGTDMTSENKEIYELIDRLRYFNKWLRGEEDKQPDPKQIDTDIDRAIDLIMNTISPAEHSQDDGNNFWGIV